MELRTRTDRNPDVEVLIEDFESHGVLVPRGFIFDGASTPRLFWAIIPPFKRTKKAACVHDWNCKQARSWEERKEADKLFYKMLKEAGLNSLRCLIGYIGVRIGAYMGIGVYYGM